MAKGWWEVLKDNAAIVGQALGVAAVKQIPVVGDFLADLKGAHDEAEVNRRLAQLEANGAVIDVKALAQGLEREAARVRPILQARTPDQSVYGLLPTDSAQLSKVQLQLQSDAIGGLSALGMRMSGRMPPASASSQQSNTSGQRQSPSAERPLDPEARIQVRASEMDPTTAAMIAAARARQQQRGKVRPPEQIQAVAEKDVPPPTPPKAAPETREQVMRRIGETLAVMGTHIDQVRVGYTGSLGYTHDRIEVPYPQDHATQIADVLGRLGGTSGIRVHSKGSHNAVIDFSENRQQLPIEDLTRVADGLQQLRAFRQSMEDAGRAGLGTALRGGGNGLPRGMSGLQGVLDAQRMMDVLEGPAPNRAPVAPGQWVDRGNDPGRGGSRGGRGGGAGS